MKTLAECHEEHVEHMRSLNFSRYTIRQSRCCVGVFLRWAQAAHGVATPDRLRPRHMQAWQKVLAKRTTWKGRPLKARSVNKHVETLNGFLKYMAEGGAMARSMASVLQYVKEPVFLPGSVLSHEQMGRMLAAVPTDTPEGYRLRTMLEVLYSSGMRIAELLGLNLGDVNFASGTAKVLGKGRKERIVPVGRTALTYLQGYIRAVRSAVAGDGQEQAIFLDGAGRRFPYYTFRRLVHATAARAGLDRTVTPTRSGAPVRRSCSGAAPTCTTSRSCLATSRWRP